MSPTPRQRFQVRPLVFAIIFVAGALLFGCGPEGAGSIHISARKKLADTKVGQLPKATARTGSLATPVKPLPRPNAKNSGQKKH
jgi:hypothetical protein